MMATGLERAVERGSGRQQPRLGEGHGLGVRLARAEVVAAPDHLAIPDEHCADERVGVRAATASFRELEGLVHIQRVVHQKTPQSHAPGRTTPRRRSMLLSSGL